VSIVQRIRTLTVGPTPWLHGGESSSPDRCLSWHCS